MEPADKERRPAGHQPGRSPAFAALQGAFSCEAHDQPMTPHAPPPNLTRILLIEPDSSLAAALTLFLEASGHQVDVADTTFVDGEQRATAGYDAIVLDADELSEPAAAFMAASPIPVVVCTRSTEPAVHEQFWSFGARTVLLKPFPMEELGSAIFVALMVGSDR